MDKSEGVSYALSAPIIAEASGTLTTAWTAGVPAAPRSPTRIASAESADAWFGPQSPLRPMAPPSVAGRQFDYGFGANLNYNPRGDSDISFTMLRNLADALPLLRIVLEKRKDQIAGWKWDVVKRDDGSGRRRLYEPGRKEEPRILELRAFFTRPDRRNSFHTWMRMLLEDMLVIDAACVYPRKTRGGGIYSLDVIDGSTVKPLIDASGRLPLPEDGPAYQQVLHGLPAADFTLDELRYIPRNRRSHRIYGYSPVEWIITTVNTAIRRDVFNLEYYNTGSLPEAFGTLPENWTIDQIRQFQDYFDAMMSGQLAQRRRIKFMPSGFAAKEVRAPPLKDAYDDWLARIICAAFSIPVAPFVADNNRATAQSIQVTANQEGIEPLKAWVKDFMDPIIQNDLGCPDLEFKWSGQDMVDPLVQAQAIQIYVNTGVMGRDEAREGLGLEPFGVGPTVSGPIIPVVEAYKHVLEMLKDPETAAAASGVALPAPARDPAAKQSGNATPRSSKPDGRAQSTKDKTKSAAKKGATATLYVHRPLDNAEAVIRWAKDQGFATTLLGDDLHATIAYSKTPFDQTGLIEDDTKIVIVGGARSIEVFGTAVVLRFEAPPLAERWQAIRDAGASWDHDGYHPHITITYDAADLDLTGVTPYDGPLTFGPEVFAPIDNDWSDGLQEA